jgi:hypothetical protein
VIDAGLKVLEHHDHLVAVGSAQSALVPASTGKSGHVETRVSCRVDGRQDPRRRLDARRSQAQLPLRLNVAGFRGLLSIGCSQTWSLIVQLVTRCANDTLVSYNVAVNCGQLTRFLTASSTPDGHQ